MATDQKSPIYIPLEGVESEHCALIVDKGLDKVKGINSHVVELNNNRAVITTTDNAVVADAVNAIRDLGYGVNSIKKNIPVLDMTCASCAISTESIIKAQPGVVNASVNFATATVAVEYLPNLINIEDIQKAVQSIGYDLLIGNEDKEAETLEEIHAQKFGQLKRKTLWASLISIPVVVIGMFFMDMPYANEIMWVLSTPVVLWFGKDFFINAWKQTKHGSANMDTLVALGSGIAYLFSVFNTLFPSFWMERGLHGHVYFEAAAVIISFILLGKLLEEKAKGNTSSAIKKLMGLQPKTVTLIKENDQQVTIEIEAVSKGDIILVKAWRKDSCRRFSGQR